MIAVLLFVILILIIERLTIRMSKYPFEMRNSAVHGRGVFATRRIAKDEIIEHVPVILFDPQDIKEGTILKDYDIHYDDYKLAMMFGYGAIYNHSFENNAAWNFKDDKTLLITANRDIECDEEIFVNYGPNYWLARPQLNPS